MCNPALLIGAQVTGGLLSASAAARQSSAARAGYEAQAAVAQNNAQLAEWQAQDALKRGADAETIQRMKAAQVKGTQTAALAGSGFLLSSDSAQNILTGTDYLNEQDAAAIRDSAAREAWGRRAEADSYRRNAGLLRARGAAESPFLAGATSLLGSATGVASSWYKFKSTGVW